MLIQGLIMILNFQKKKKIAIDKAYEKMMKKMKRKILILHF